MTDRRLKVSKLTLALFLVPLLLGGCSHREPEWRSALQENSISGYSAFLSKYPDGPHANEARERVDILKTEDSEWVASQQGDRIQAYARFLRRASEFPPPGGSSDSHGPNRCPDAARLGAAI